MSCKSFRGVFVASFLLGQHIVLPQTTPVRALVSRYVAALQQRDSRTIGELNYFIRRDESLIRFENPKLLWPKLIAEHRDGMVRGLNGGEKPRDISDALSFVPPECKWAIAEVRAGSDLRHQFSRVFVTVTYTAWQNSPRNEKGEPLQRAILEFLVMAPESSTVFYSKRVEAGDVLWPLSNEDQKRGAEKGAKPAVIEPMVVDQPPVVEAPAINLQSLGWSPGSLPSLTERCDPLVKMVPVYPPLARQALIQGTVRFNAIVGKEGTVQSLTVVSGHPLLVPAAEEAAKKFIFASGTERRCPVDVDFTLSSVGEMTSPPQENNRPSGPQRIGDGNSAPLLISKVEPEYSEEARKAKFQGTVVIYATIGSDGIAHNIQVVRPLGLGLDEKAIECVSKWRFKPGLKYGKVVEVRVTLEVNFRLL